MPSYTVVSKLASIRHGKYGVCDFQLFWIKKTYHNSIETDERDKPKANQPTNQLG